MLKKERQAVILHQVNLHTRVFSSSLSLETSVSEDIIRRGPRELADESRFKKVYGYALFHSFNQVYYHSNNVYSHYNKKIITQKAASMEISEAPWHVEELLLYQTNLLTCNLLCTTTVYN